MIEYIVLGTLQGITEWLPVSSEGVIVLVSTYLFPNFSLSEAIRLALFLHLGTFLAAAAYLYNDLKVYAHEIKHYATMSDTTKKELLFLCGATVVTGCIALPLILLIDESAPLILQSTTIIGLAVGALLIVTGTLHAIYQSHTGTRTSTELTKEDGLLAGAFQSFAALPGLSRSGLTVAALLMRGFTDNAALRLSFLMSLPTVLGGNIILNADSVRTFGSKEALALFFAFIAGLATIHGLMKVARNISWAAFTIGAGVLLIVGALL